ncbi:long-chain fatty acid--CoA ligase [Nakamurella antarctica]|uniref:Acyl-CoA synthetase n=1 Tax=Nakamurella antarctica TaxID=1902245 RepID=A0A3G8ZU53_9ACTN|nr:long-chain fatty acid--CoA ligase [Nakamurella antarctica]AZI57321.1 long-chain fatty acid--CoA ligase [Nakamurella antarctica]
MPPSAPAVADRQTSFGQMFTDRVRATPTREAFRYPSGGDWSSLTWAQTQDRVFAISAGLIGLGIKPEERVAIICSTRIEWILSDLGIMCAGAATTTIYPTTAAEDVAYVTFDSGSRIVIVEDQTQVDKVKSKLADLPDLFKIIVIDGVGDSDLVITLAELEKHGRELLASSPALVTEAIAAIRPDSLATLIYTSGTTGKPKGVRLLHSSWTYEGWAVEKMNILDDSDVQYLWLPLSHVFGKVLLAVQLRLGFSTAVDGNLDRIVENLAVVKPTFMAGAPRIFEKVRAKVMLTAQGEGGLKTKIFNWAFTIGHEVSRRTLAGESVPATLKLQHGVAQKLVFAKVQARLGGRIRFFVSGSAALSRPVAQWYAAVGMPLVEGYGLSETSAATFVGRPDDLVFGTVGPPLTGTEVKIAEDGEILVRGPGVMSGYHNLPDVTAEVLDADGWFCTGDIGKMVDGKLMVTDRKKDLIKTSGGKYIAPQKIEILFKAISPYASQIVVHGEGRNFVSALITVDADAITDWAKTNGLEGKSYAELTKAPQVRDLIDGQVQELNSKLERWETIKKFEILPKDLTIEDGSITPSLKVRRKTVEQQNMSLLNSLYKN